MSSELSAGLQPSVENLGGGVPPNEVVQAEGQATLHALAPHTEMAKRAVTASIEAETDITVDLFKDCTNLLDGLTIYAERQRLSGSDEEREKNYMQWTSFQQRLDASGHR